MYCFLGEMSTEQGQNCTLTLIFVNFVAWDFAVNNSSKNRRFLHRFIVAKIQKNRDVPDAALFKHCDNSAI